MGLPIPRPAEKEAKETSATVASHFFTAYFENRVLPRRPYLTHELCIRVLKRPLKVEIQADGRIRFLDYTRRDRRSAPASRDSLGPTDRAHRFYRSELQAMKILHDVDTDMLYIDLSDRPSADSEEVSPGVVIDYDAAGDFVGIEIENANGKLDLDELTFKVPFQSRRRSA